MTPRNTDQLLGRLADRITPGPGGCWIWTGATVRGYGRIRFNDVTYCTHRLAYEQMVGPIPEGLVLDHLCRTPGCLRPDHLEPVRQRENLRRGATHWGLIEATGKCQRGHDFATHAIQRGQWRGCGECIRQREQRRVRDRQVPTTCSCGRERVPRSNGRLYCPPCASEARKRKP